MARMLGYAVANTVSCCRRHSPPDVRRNGYARQREKRVTQQWLNEYETPHDYDGCPNDGLACTCNKTDLECPHQERQCASTC